MNAITFITGNQNKADYLAAFLWYPIDHIRIDVDEIQSTDLHTIVDHKVRQAYDIIKKPVIVEDVSLEFDALGWLPGPFIKFFVDNTPFDALCAMVADGSRACTARCVFGYFDGSEPVFFEGSLRWELAKEPAWTNWFGWDTIFIPQGYSCTKAWLSPQDNKKVALQIKPFAAVKEFLEKNTQHT